MPMDFTESKVYVPLGVGRRQIEETVGFPSTVRHAAVLLNGFEFQFEGIDDKHLKMLEVDTDLLSTSGSEVTFRVECFFTDKNSDDTYSGSVDVLVVAELD